MALFARIVSFVTNPIFVLFPVPFLLVYRFGYGGIYAIKWTLFSFIFMVIAGLFVLYEVKHKVFSDMDVSKREQRPLLFAVLGSITVIYFISLFMLNAPPVLFITVWGIMIGILLASIINTRVKASLHVGTITAVFITLVKLYDWTYLVFLLIPLVAWSRIRIKRHTERSDIWWPTWSGINTIYVYSVKIYLRFVIMIRPKRLIKSFGYAFEGLEHAYRYDQNLRIHFFIGTIVVLISILLKLNSFEMGILGVMILLVMVTEMINTALERMVDLITKEHREDAKIAKDVAAGMVFLTAVGSVIVGALIFYPHIMKLIQ